MVTSDTSIENAPRIVFCSGRLEVPKDIIISECPNALAH